MLARDLASAGIAKEDATGAVFDFHSLRSQFATDLERAGVGLAAAQPSCDIRPRHSRVSTTPGEMPQNWVKR